MTLARESGVVIIPGRDDIPALIGTVDIYPTEEHEVSAEVTSYPVESGASLVDNVVIRPKRLRLSGRTSNLLPAPGNHVYPGRATDAWQTLIWLMERRERMTVSTLLGDYDDMVITRVRAPVDVSTGDSLRFEMELREILPGVVMEMRLSPDRVSGAASGRTAEVDGGQRLSRELDAAESTEMAAVMSVEVNEDEGFFSFGGIVNRVKGALSGLRGLFRGPNDGEGAGG